MVSSLEKEKIEHKDTIEKYEGHIKLISEKLKDAEEQLRKEKETITNYELNSKKNTVELREAARHATARLRLECRPWGCLRRHVGETHEARHGAYAPEDS